MKQGTIQIDCGDETCGECTMQYMEGRYVHRCAMFGGCVVFFNKRREIERCQQCLETFKEIKDEDN